MKTPLLFILALVPAVAIGQAATTAAPQAQQSVEAATTEHKMIRASDIQWGPGPAALPKGVEAAVVYGDPGKPGPFAIRLKAPPGFKVGRHWHPTDEQVTILSGDFTMSMGEGDKAHSADFGPGDHVSLPAKMQHAASTKNGAIVQVASHGPFEVNYVDPKDDPRKAEATSAK